MPHWLIWINRLVWFCNMNHFHIFLHLPCPTVNLVSDQLVSCYGDSCDKDGEWNHLVNTRSTSKCSKFEDDFMKIYSFSSSLQKIKKQQIQMKKQHKFPQILKNTWEFYRARIHKRRRGGHMPIVNRLKVNLIIHWQYKFALLLCNRLNLKNGCTTGVLWVSILNSFFCLLEYVIPPPAPWPKKTHVMVLACVNVLECVMVLSCVIPLPVPNWASAEAQFIPNFSLSIQIFLWSIQIFLWASKFFFEHPNFSLSGY